MFAKADMYTSAPSIWRFVSSSMVLKYLIRFGEHFWPIGIPPFIYFFWKKLIEVKFLLDSGFEFSRPWEEFHH